MPTAASHTWAEVELGDAVLGDPRRTRRLTTLVHTLAARPATSLPQACGAWAATKGAYRFLANKHVAPAAVRAAHQRRTLERVAAEPLVLLVQDTTHLEFASQPHIADLGPLNTRAHPGRGLLLHSTLALSAEGLPLGLLDQQLWARSAEAAGQRTQRKQRAIQAKESAKWLRGVAAAAAQLPPEQPTLVVADREADVYDLFLAPRGPRMHLLIRAAWDRRVRSADPAATHLWAAAQGWPEQDRQAVRVPRADQRPERQATVSLRWGSLHLQPPRHRGGERLPAVPLQGVLVQEVAPPAGVPPLEWLLLTTLPVASTAGAWQVVQRYRARWRIEQYHFVLKSGCRLEQLQLDSAERLERALALYSVVAWRLLALTYAARQQPEASAEPALSRAEWQTLWCVHHQQPVPPDEPPRLREAVRWIAQLGGFLARKGDGEPGVQTLWRGWQRLTDLTEGFHLARSLGTSG